MYFKEIIMKKQLPCHHCEGKGYIEIRDCTGEIQREETCVFCQGMGQVSSQKVAHQSEKLS